MRRSALIRKLRALAADPAAAPNEREVARVKADALEVQARYESRPTPDGMRADWVLLDDEISAAAWDGLPDPVWNGTFYDLGAYSTANLHRALHIMPDGSMNCRCHGPGHLIMSGETLLWRTEDRI